MATVMHDAGKRTFYKMKTGPILEQCGYRFTNFGRMLFGLLN